MNQKFTRASALAFTLLMLIAPTMSAQVTFDTLPQDLTIECDGLGNTAELNLYLANNAGASANSPCGLVVWSNDFDPGNESLYCGLAGGLVVSYTATDPCGDTASYSAAISIEDTTGPTIVTPSSDRNFTGDSKMLNADLIEWLSSNGGANAMDLCAGSTVVWTNNFNHLVGCGMSEAAEVTFTATDECGNYVSTTSKFMADCSSAAFALGIENISDEIAVYPSPASSFVNAKTPASFAGRLVSISVYDMNGKRVFETVSADAETKIDFPASMQDGRYFLIYADHESGEKLNTSFLVAK